MDGVQQAKSGHPGMPMGMAPAAHLLWTGYLRHNPGNPAWPNRDRFVLSAGHGSMLLYSLLYLSGYGLSLDDLRNFRQWHSKTPGHPEYGETPGVELTTGPLGQGISNAVGMAIAEKFLAARFNREGYPVIQHRVFVIAGDGDLQEGVSAEASSLAGHLGLDNLVVLYDDNHITIDGSTSLSFTESVTARYAAYGWFVQQVDGDGNDLHAIGKALDTALSHRGRPSLIRIRTHIGYGSPNKQDTAEAHGSPLGADEVAATKARYGLDPAGSFVVPDAVLQQYQAVATRGHELEREWKTLFASYTSDHPDLAREFDRAASKQLPADWEAIWARVVPQFDPAASMATREAQGKILDAVLPHIPLVIGGSADLTPSNNTRFKGVEDFTATRRDGRYLRFGVREHAMGAILNGIAVGGMVIPYGATFFTFSDYMRPAIRLAAMSQYPSIFVFTHDSIGLGEDGPTHQPVEHLASLRAMPGLVILRPADANETAFAWKFALENRLGPTVLVLTRQKLPVLDQHRFTPAQNLVRGAYVLTGSDRPQVILLATGSEVHLALEAYQRLSGAGVPARVVSMPSWELFERQPRAYRHEVLPPAVTARVGIEAAVGFGWERYLGSKGAFIGMDRFGASAPYETLYKQFGLTVDRIVDVAHEVMT
ncbi:MAG: tkt [Bacteroidetes bacterium]|nr:tkt [Bacteroidota bacterium]